MDKKIEKIFNNIKKDEMCTMQEYLVFDVLDLFANGYDVCLIKIQLQENEKQELLSSLHTNENIISILQLKTNNNYYFLIVSSVKLNIKHTCTFVEYANLLEKLPLNSITFFYTQPDVFNHLLIRWLGGIVFWTPAHWIYYKNINELNTQHSKKINGNLDFSGIACNTNGQHFNYEKTTLKNFINYFKID